MTWPKVIGIAVGAFGLGATLFAIASWLSFGFTWPAKSLQSYNDLVGLVGSMFFLALSYPLYRGRNWARRLLLVVCVCVSLSCVVFAARKIATESHSRLPLLKTIGVAIAFLTPPLFLLCVLLHQDVTASFGASSRDDTRSTI
jgi:hypothetical protein